VISLMVLTFKPLDGPIRSAGSLIT